VKKRRLKPEELELWQRVADQTEALHNRQTVAMPSDVPAPSRPKKGPLRQPIQLDGKTPPQPAPHPPPHDLLKPLPERLRQSPVQMDRKTFARMARGKLKPEARIDLHGMTLDRAHGALTRFILSAHGNGKRLVLVITGKGKDRDEGGPIPTRFGVLRHQVPVWLGLAPLKSVVLQVSQAHISHGGGGAYYVYLKRQR
jgi:DNA-nicking Smr family endonuclease